MDWSPSQSGGGLATAERQSPRNFTIGLIRFSEGTPLMNGTRAEHFDVRQGGTLDLSAKEVIWNYDGKTQKRQFPSSADGCKYNLGVNGKGKLSLTPP